jgi:hypothetical protein
MQIKEIQNKMDTLASEYSYKNISDIDYFIEMSSLEKEYSKIDALTITINSILIVIYYIFIPYICKFQTLGMKIMKLKIIGKNDKCNLMNLFIRTFIVDGLLSCLILIFAVYLIGSKFYLSFVSILTILQLLTLIINYFMIKYSNNCLGLSDILSNSKVVKIS